MNAIIKQIQEALEHGRPSEIKTGPLATQVIKEIQMHIPKSEDELKKETLQRHES